MRPFEVIVLTEGLIPSRIIDSNRLWRRKQLKIENLSFPSALFFFRLLE
jgi:hypothetical protein